MRFPQSVLFICTLLFTSFAVAQPAPPTTRPAKDPQGDPHAGESGYYAIPAVNLVADAEGYEPEYILLWLPNEQAYGTWDTDHAELLVFPDVSWTDIAADPLPFVAAQWDGPEPGVPFVPYPKYPYKPGRPF